MADSRIASKDRERIRGRNRKPVALVLGTVLLIGAIPILALATWLIVGTSQSNATRNMLTNEVDHLPVRDASRAMLAEHALSTFIDLPQLPGELARLHPKSAYVDERGFLRLEFAGGMHQQGLLIVPRDSEQIELDTEPPLEFTLLAEGIWYYEES